MIQINQNNPTASSTVDTISIDGQGKVWIGEFPKPNGLKAIKQVTMTFRWTEYNRYNDYSAFAQILPCPCTYEDVTYQKVLEAGGFDYRKIWYIDYPLQDPPVLPHYANITISAITEAAFLKSYFKNYTYAIIAGTEYPQASATISNVTIDYTYMDAIPYATNMSPLSGVIDEKSDNIFKWDIGFSGIVGESLKQNGAKFEWKLKGEDDSKIRTLNLSGETKSYTLPAKTLKDGDIFLYRLTLTSNAGITGESCKWIELGTKETKSSKCKCLSPVNIYVDGSVDVPFRWEHISSINGISTGYDIQFKKSGQWVGVKTDVKTEERTCLIEVSELSAGQNYWRARTYNSDGVVGYWSEPASFYVVAAPNPPKFISVESGRPRPLVRWSSIGQTGWQLQAVQNSEVIYDSGMNAGTATQSKISNYLDDGTYTFKLRIQNEFNKLSEWTEYNYTIKTTKPSKPTFTGFAVEDVGIKIRLTYTLKSGEIAKVKRDGKIIGDITNEYTDYSALGTCTYSVLIIDKNDCFNESDRMSLTYSIRDVQLSLASDMSKTVHLNMQRGTSQAIRAVSDKYDTSQSNYSGRKYPCIDFSEHTESSVTLNFAYSDDKDFKKLSELLETKETLLYRDRTGERFYCAATGLSNDKFKHATDFSISLVKVDFEG